MLPSEYPEVQGYPNLKRALQNQVDMQVADLRILLQLPANGFKEGCNLTAASALFNLIAGSSVCFYKANPEAFDQRGDRGERFKGILRDFYPWEREPLPKEKAVGLLYESARNPLVHTLGLEKMPENAPGKEVYLMKWPLDLLDIEEIEEASSKPDLPPTVEYGATLSSGAVMVFISIPTLYWGMHRMLRSLFATSHVIGAERLAQTFGWRWARFVAETGRGDDRVLVRRTCGKCGAELTTDDGQDFRCRKCDSA